jgi:hypothetical protein
MRNCSSPFLACANTHFYISFAYPFRGYNMIYRGGDIICKYPNKLAVAQHFYVIP